MAEDNPAVEVKSAGDEGWFEARLEIDGADPTRLLAKVPGLEEEEGEALTNKDAVKSRVRFPSEQVHDKQCGEVVVNDILCALNNTPTSSRYYDASVLKVEKHDHQQNRGHEVCTCEFLVSWLAGPDKGETSVVGCECLCKINTTPIETHPVVAKYLSN